MDGDFQAAVNCKLSQS